MTLNNGIHAFVGGGNGVAFGVFCGDFIKEFTAVKEKLAKRFQSTGFNLERNSPNELCTMTKAAGRFAAALGFG